MRIGRGGHCARRAYKSGMLKGERGKMLVLITYDVNTQTDAGKRRLRQVAKCCQDYGIRVQCSVFECVLDSAQLATVRHRLEGIIDPKLDSLRFYNLGNRTARNTLHIGAKPAPDMEDALIL